MTVLDGGAISTLAHGPVLLEFADNAIARNVQAIELSRNKVVNALGREAMIDAAAVIGGFDGITRIADGTGVPLERSKAEQTEDLRDQLQLNSFRKC